MFTLITTLVIGNFNNGVAIRPTDFSENTEEIILPIQGVPELAPQRKKGALGRIY
jgi:hypothetical protein